MQAQWLDIPEEQNEHAPHSHRCAVCGAFPPPPPPTLPGDGDIGGIEYLMMRGTWLRYMGLGKGTWFKIEFDGRRIISTPVYPPGFRVLHMPTSLLREVHYAQVREYRHHPRPRPRRRSRR